VYLWSAIAVAGVAMPVGIVAFRALMGACDRLLSHRDRMTPPSLPSVPLPSSPG
jgi:hypothetical protein